MRRSETLTGQPSSIIWQQTTAFPLTADLTCEVAEVFLIVLCSRELLASCSGSRARLLQLLLPLPLSFLPLLCVVDRCSSNLRGFFFNPIFNRICQLMLQQESNHWRATAKCQSDLRGGKDKQAPHFHSCIELHVLVTR